MTEERTNWEMTQPKPPPIGVSNYKDACTNYYYVDKTMMIKELLDERAKGNIRL